MILVKRLLQWVLVFAFVLLVSDALALPKKFVRNSDAENVPFCSDSGLQCVHCVECFPGGFCVTDGKEPQCVCQYGWTGPGAHYISGSTKPNLLRASSCDRPCHYTHHVRYIAKHSFWLKQNSADLTAQN